MDKLEFQALLRNEIQNAHGYYDNEYGIDRIKAMDYYMGEKYGNEQEGRSQVVTTEVADTIEFIMPSLMRTFTQTDDFVKFMPRGEEDVEGAEQATSYANYVINCQNNGHFWSYEGLQNYKLVLYEPALGNCSDSYIIYDQVEIKEDTEDSYYLVDQGENLKRGQCTEVNWDTGCVEFLNILSDAFLVLLFF